MSAVTEHHECPDTIDLIAGRLCLDFVNTVDWREDADVADVLRGYADLVAWARHADVLAADDVERLLTEGARRPADASSALARAIALRETLYRVFAAAMRGQTAEAGDLDAFNVALARAMSQTRIAPGVNGAMNGYVWTWVRGNGMLDEILHPIVRSAAELLTSADLTRVRKCAGKRCGWLFLDTSRNHRRRWCSMEDCGNRAKARRHYQRQRTPHGAA